MGYSLKGFGLAHKGKSRYKGLGEGRTQIQESRVETLTLPGKKLKISKNPLQMLLINVFFFSTFSPPKLNFPGPPLVLGLKNSCKILRTACKF